MNQLKKLSESEVTQLREAVAELNLGVERLPRPCKEMHWKIVGQPVKARSHKGILIWWGREYKEINTGIVVSLIEIWELIAFYSSMVKDISFEFDRSEKVFIAGIHIPEVTEQIINGHIEYFINLKSNKN